MWLCRGQLRSVTGPITCNTRRYKDTDGIDPPFFNQKERQKCTKSCLMKSTRLFYSRIGSSCCCCQSCSRFFGFRAPDLRKPVIVRFHVSSILPQRKSLRTWNTTHEYWTSELSSLTRNNHRSLSVNIVVELSRSHSTVLNYRDINLPDEGQGRCPAQHRFAWIICVSIVIGEYPTSEARRAVSPCSPHIPLHWTHVFHLLHLFLPLQNF